LTKNVAVKVQAGNVYRVPAAWLEAAA